MMKKPTSYIMQVFKKNGCLKHIEMKSYVVVLCKKGGADVKAIRVDDYERVADVREDICGNYPDWNIKRINRLYDEDFDEGLGSEKGM